MNTVEATHHPVNQTVRLRPYLLAAPVGVLLAMQVAMYLWMAPRAFEFTDEAFYLLNLLHWQEMQASVTFFGAFFDLPFKLLGEDIAAIRVLSLLLLLVCGGFLGHHVLCTALPDRGRRSNDIRWAILLTAGSSALLYFSYLSTLRVPSYNLGALCAAMVATGLMLKLERQNWPSRSGWHWMFLYGVAIGICGLCKATSGLAVVVLHGVYILLVGRIWLTRHGLPLILLALAGVALDVGYLFVRAADWLQMLQQGIAFTSVMDGRDVVGLANLARWQLQKMLSAHWVVASGVSALYLGAVWALSKTRAFAWGLPELLLMLVAITPLVSVKNQSLWLPMLALAVGLTLVSHRLRAGALRQSADGKRVATLIGVLLLMPLALSFGTGMSVWDHSQINAVFAVMALLAALARLRGAGYVNSNLVAVCITALALPATLVQFGAWSQVERSYRQLQPLSQQTHTIELAGRTTRVMVDEETRHSIKSVLTAAEASGWAPDRSVLDFTGDGPGWIYALGAHPIAVPWLLGGYPGSRENAKIIVDSQQVAKLKSAWILSSSSNPRRIENWQALIESRLGENSHELVAAVKVTAPYRWGAEAPPQVDVQLWRPIPR